MNDYQLSHLAADRRHDLAREAANERLARQATTHQGHRGQPHGSSIKPRNTLRLTVDFLLGRAAS